MKKLSLFLLLSTSIITTALADNISKPWWISLGAGAFSGHNITDNCKRIYSSYVGGKCRDMGGVEAFLLNYSYMPKKNQLLSVNYFRANYDDFIDGLFGTPTDQGYINAISVEYGLIQRWRYGHLSGTLGPAFVNNRGAYDDQELYPPSSHSGIGISGKLEAAVTPFRYFGLAISLVGNYNGNMPYYGAFLSLQFGNFRP